MESWGITLPHDLQNFSEVSLSGCELEKLVSQLRENLVRFTETSLVSTPK